MKEFKITTKKVLIGILCLGLIIFLCNAGKLIEFVDSSEIVVKQSAFDGKLTVYFTAGPIFQNYGTCTHYKKRAQYWFSKSASEGDTSDQSIKIRFNDGGHATLSGSISYYMPTDTAGVIKVHSMFNGQENIEHQLIKQVVNKSIYMTGPLMSSKESSAEKRTDLLAYIEDQAIGGIYKTEQVETKVHDDLMNTDKTVMKVKIVQDKSGFVRQDKSPVSIYHITLDNLTINSIDYDKDVEAQIKEQQKITMMIQTATANSRKAEQDALTAELTGKAGATKAKWDQEILKAQAVTQAQQEKEVAALAAQTAVYEAQATRTAADAESYKNAKLVSAGLSPKDKADYAMKTQIGVAEALSKMTLPNTYFNGMSNNGNSSASMLESILGVKLLDYNKQLPASK
jgi:hypothetical protein